VIQDIEGKAQFYLSVACWKDLFPKELHGLVRNTIASAPSDMMLEHSPNVSHYNHVMRMVGLKDSVLNQCVITIPKWYVLPQP